MTRRLLRLAGAALFASASLAACTIGPGEGEVVSDLLEIEGCSNGHLDLEPNFFAADSYGGAVKLRLQRGDLLEEASDGFLVLVRDVASIVGDETTPGALGEDLEVGLPEGVRPPGAPIVGDAEPPRVSMVLYLNDSCDDQNVSVYSISGSIRFASLWNGASNASGEARLTEATFAADFADSRGLANLVSGDEVPTSRIEGSFRFYFQRSQPAQPFP